MSFTLKITFPSITFGNAKNAHEFTIDRERGRIRNKPIYAMKVSRPVGRGTL